MPAGRGGWVGGSQGVAGLHPDSRPDDIRDEAAAAQFYRESAAAGWPRGQLGMAMALLREGSLESNAQAVALLGSAAAEDVPVAHHLLGMLAESGGAGTTDYTEAAARYKRAAELGHVPAQVRYGFALLHGRGTEPDAFTAETWLRRAATAGDVQAAAVVGYLYAREGELPPNHAEAAIWFERAAQGGHAGAARMLGHMLLFGTGLAKNVPEAVHWLRFAAAQGDETARASLIHLALMRQVGEDDQREAAVWLEQAAAAGSAEASFHLGLCLAQGIGVEQNLPAALHWICRAAEAAHPNAVRMLRQSAAEE